MHFPFKLPFYHFYKTPEKTFLQWGKGQVCLLMHACDLSTGEDDTQRPELHLCPWYLLSSKEAWGVWDETLSQTNSNNNNNNKNKIEAMFIHWVFCHGWVGPWFNLAAYGKAECHNGNCVVTIVCFLLHSCESERKEGIQTSFRATHPKTLFSLPRLCLPITNTTG